MQRQMSLPTLPMKHIRANALDRRRRRRAERDRASGEGAMGSMGVADITPRCLRAAGWTTAEELREGLDQAME
eukprot:9322-Eustigmatos_ZCMA.PRE.1